MVTNALDKGAGSFRDTIKNANSGDTILFAPALVGPTITLTSGALLVNKSLDIEGPGPSLLAVSAGDASRVFEVSQDTNKPAVYVTVTIAGLTIMHGRGTGAPDGGGGIL